MGLSLIFGVLEIVNFAHGEFYMLGAMLAYFLSMNVGLGYWPTVLVVTAVAVALGYVLYEALLGSLRGQSFERSILLTLGLSMVLQNGAVFLFTTTPRMMQTRYSYRNVIVGLGNISGAALAAVALGILESVAGGFLPLVMADALAFIAMIAILLLRPRGLFGRGVRV